jgi:DNA-directed RNA polymerase specialized sigma24 family protein
MPPDPAAAMIEEEVIAAERNASFRAAFNELPPTCYELLSMLISDPPRAYTEISERLGIAVGSIGPVRTRCLDRLRRSPHLNACSPPRPGRSRSRILGSEHRG